MPAGSSDRARGLSRSAATSPSFPRGPTPPSSKGSVCEAAGLQADPEHSQVHRQTQHLRAALYLWSRVCSCQHRLARHAGAGGKGAAVPRACSTRRPSCGHSVAWAVFSGSRKRERSSSGNGGLFLRSKFSPSLRPWGGKQDGAIPCRHSCSEEEEVRSFNPPGNAEGGALGGQLSQTGPCPFSLRPEPQQDRRPAQGSRGGGGRGGLRPPSHQRGHGPLPHSAPGTTRSPSQVGSREGPVSGPGPGT